MKKFHEYLEENGFVLKEKKWISGAIKEPGRCADMGGPDCPEGSPQYKLAMRLKPGGDLYKGKKKTKKPKK